MATEVQVLQFLEEWKSVKNIDIVSRTDNRETIKELWLTFKAAKEILKNLALENYVAGPVYDRDRKSKKKDMWIFGIFMERKEVYIKIRLYEFEGQKKAKCISFHITERPQKYPFIGGKNHE